MARRIVAVFILLFAFLIGYSKDGKVYGKVTDDKGLPVDRCLVKIIGTNSITYTNAHGEFFIDDVADSLHSLLVSCEGYETKEVRIIDDAIWVILKRKFNKLSDVAVHASQGEGTIETAKLGKRHLIAHGICSDITGSETAIRLNANRAKHGFLQELFFYITKAGVPDAPFKVHVYDIEDELPGKELLDSTVILHANAGEEWVSVDISSRHIAAGRGVFIAVEWLSGSGNNPTVISYADYTGQWRYNTMALGISKGDGSESPQFYQRSNFYHEWHNADAMPEWHGKHMAPMIYATYTYYVK